jgi:2-dehydro-3-deoxyphosphogluconate aldolase/(4S)-4-hydroxy-2-oxoglutarate aldolase
MEIARKWRTQPGEILRQGPVVPVMVVQRLEQAVPLARALVAGGIRVLEITLRTPAAVAVIAAISRDVPDAIVGAGTVTRGEELQAVAAAGAVFAISPGLTPELLDAANRGPIPLIPGIATVSELMAGFARGYDHFKFFPAGPAGGVKMLQAFAGPFPHVTFCPTGGISADNYREYLGLPNVACVGCSWVAPQAAMDQGDWARITALAREAVAHSGR